MSEPTPCTPAPDAPGTMPDVLPEGICRLPEGALGNAALAPFEMPAAGPVRLAVFDFDGTSIRGSSPVQLVRYLGLRRRLSVWNLFVIGLWGLAYKLRLPQNEAWVRGRVFRAFRGRPVAEVNEFLWGFCAEVIEPRFRAAADAAMCSHGEQGHAVMCVSATFEPIIAAAMTAHPIRYGIATRMAADANGDYENRVLGQPIEGATKLEAVRRFADARFGEGRWVLDAAYGDHHSDRTLLSAAERAYVVDPNRPLARTARERGWTVLDWE